MVAKNFIHFEGMKSRLFSILHQTKHNSMRTLRFRPSFPSFPTSCIHRKVSDERPKRTLEMADFPLHILESRRKERLAELKAECIELGNQISENNSPVALLHEAELENETNSSKNQRILSGQHSKSMHELRGLPPVLSNGSGRSNLSVVTICSEDSMRKRREARLQTIRRELEEFAIKYSIGEFATNIDGLITSPVQNTESDLIGLKVSSVGGQNESSIVGLTPGLDAADAASVLRIQRHREVELQRARMELKHLAFRLKHKIDEENSDPASNKS